jgi:hypothetical protein
MSTRRNNFCLTKPDDYQKDSLYSKQETLFKFKRWKPYRQAICVVKAAAVGISESLAHLWTANKSFGKENDNPLVLLNREYL